MVGVHNIRTPHRSPQTHAAHTAAAVAAVAAAVSSSSSFSPLMTTAAAEVIIIIIAASIINSSHTHLNRMKEATKNVDLEGCKASKHQRSPAASVESNYSPPDRLDGTPVRRVRACVTCVCVCVCMCVCVCVVCVKYFQPEGSLTPRNVFGCA
jgi:hypothetical protein